jgi:hypothetical protein
LDGWSHFEGLFLDAKPTSGPLAALKYPKNDVDVISVTKDIRKSDLKGLVCDMATNYAGLLGVYAAKRITRANVSSFIL